MNLFRWMARGVGGAVLLCGVTLCPALSQATSRPSRSIEERLPTIIPVVEALRGLRLDRAVAVSPCDVAYLTGRYRGSPVAAADASDVADGRGRALKLLRLIADDADYAAESAKLVENVGAFYDPQVCAIRLVQPAGEGGVPNRWIVNSVVAHELCHALQDQHLGLRAVLPDQRGLGTVLPNMRRNDDVMAAALALVEGDASVLQAAFEANVGNASKPLLFEPRAAGIRGRTEEAPVPGMRDLSGASFPIACSQFPYCAGAEFCLTLCTPSKSFAAVDKAFGDPPLSSEQILHPAKYLAAERDNPILLDIPDISADMGEGWSRLMGNTLGEFGVRWLLQRSIPAPAAAMAAAGWGGDHYEVWQRRGARDVLIWMTTWDDEGEAGQFELALCMHLAKVYGKAREPDFADTRATEAFHDGKRRVEVVYRQGRDVLLMRGVSPTAAPILRDHIMKATTRTTLTAFPRAASRPESGPESRPESRPESGR